MNKHEFVDELRALFATRGDSEYGGEVVTQEEHALQCATLAENEGASPELIVAALLHDVGHLLHDLDDDAPEQGVDDCHESSGYHFLRKHFPLSVSQPVQLHVDAKRYLCTTQPGYIQTLSEPSVTSFHLQGGCMPTEQLEQFRQYEYWEDALRLRKWDDLAKVESLQTAGVEHFLTYVSQVVKQ